MTYGYGEGDVCERNGCKGIIDSQPSENCSCFQCAPCSSCTSPRNFCPVCDWHEKWNSDLVAIFTTNDGFTKEFHNEHENFKQLTNFNVGDTIFVNLTNILVAMGADKDRISLEFKERRYLVESKDHKKEEIKFKLKYTGKFSD